MNYVKLSVAGLGLMLLAWGNAVAGEQNCCLKAIAEKRECINKCCIKAHREGKSCVRCNPKKEDAKLIKKAGDKEKKVAPAKR